VRRWLIGLAILALIAGGALGAYLWNRHESGIERAVHAQLKQRGIGAGWVSCSKDHTAAAGATTVTYYRCDLHGEEKARRDGLVPLGGEACVPFVGDRVATEAEARLIRLEDSFCENQG
jgi:hypothetical protein